LSHTTTLSTGARHPAPPAPGFLAAAAEEQFFRAVQRDGAVDVTARAWTPDALAGVAASGGDPRLALLCAAVEGLWHVIHCDLDDPATTAALVAPGVPTATTVPDAARARHLLGWVVAQQARTPTSRAAAHPFVAKYLDAQTWSVGISHGVTASLGLGDDVVNLAAAELHQRAGDLATAIWTVENCLDPGTPAALSLAELYSEAGRHEDVRTLTDGVTNVDDATALLLVFRARAFARTGWYEAARECLRAATGSGSRTRAVRHRALLERAEVNLATNRRAAAREDLETILAEDPGHPGLTEALSALPAR
jgi:hypothetical protein